MLSATHAIQWTHLHDEVLSKLRAMILRGDMAPGERVQERALCEQLGISRTPLREAVRPSSPVTRAVSPMRCTTAA
jgi:DNA-binding GntR family transcriptional regulator